ncbi:MAG TPA: sterol desaturase family protein [Myxococcota bacterium]|nr:sterol desaturase family protein [Myxococcota bacterium]
MSVPLQVAAVALVMLAVETLWPGRAWPRVPGWWRRALVFTAVQAGAVWLAGTSWDGWLARHRLFAADALGTAAGAALGYLAVTLVFYAWHRARHEVPFLWRWLHQLHHSPQRLELVTSFYKHPLEMLANALLTSAVLYLLVGLGPEAATIAVLLTGVAELFYHWNVATPHWLGFLIQRPESHCLHHESGVHGRNYADLPLWDWLFGTLENPREWRGRCGFADGERRVAEMLRGARVS